MSLWIKKLIRFSHFDTTGLWGPRSDCCHMFVTFRIGGVPDMWGAQDLNQRHVHLFPPGHELKLSDPKKANAAVLKRPQHVREAGAGWGCPRFTPGRFTVSLCLCVWVKADPCVLNSVIHPESCWSSPDFRGIRMKIGSSAPPRAQCLEAGIKALPLQTPLHINSFLKKISNQSRHLRREGSFHNLLIWVMVLLDRDKALQAPSNHKMELRLQLIIKMTFSKNHS